MSIIIIRTIIGYIAVMASLRLMGKKQIGEMEPSELVVTIIISEIVAIPMVDPETPMLQGVLALLALICCEVIISALACKSEKFRAIIYGVPSRLIERGEIKQDEMKRLRISVNELSKELRIAGYADMSGINYCILETNGKLSILPFADRMPPTRKDMNIYMPEPGLTSTMIAAGKVDVYNLRKRCKDDEWLRGVLKANGVSDASEVFYMGLDEQEKVTFVKMSSV